MNNPIFLYYSQVVLFSVFPLYFASVKTGFRASYFYIYLAVVLGFGGFIGQIWAIDLTEGIRISAGNMAYAAFMMTSILFVVLEHDIAIVRNIIKLVIVVSIFKYLLFNSISYFLSSPHFINPHSISPKIFMSSASLMIVGGSLIIFELLLFLFIIEKIKNTSTHFSRIVLIFPIFFIVLLCLDGILFPLINFRFFPELKPVIIGGIKNKMVLGASFAPSMLLILLIFRKRFSDYITINIDFKDILKKSKEELTTLVQEQFYKTKESEAKYRHLYETMTQGVVIQDADGKIIEANQTAGDILGLSMDQMFGKTSYDPRWRLIQKDGSPYDADEMPSNIALRTGKPSKEAHCGIFVPEKDEYRWVVIGSAPRFKDGETKPFATTTVFTDITDHMRISEEKDMFEKQFIQAQKMESIGKLAGGIAHDYNNISSVIIGFSELALAKVEHSDPIHDDLIEVITAAKRSTEITRQLLAFARQQTIAPKILDLNDTIGSMLKMLRRLIGEDIDLAWMPGAEIWPIKIDTSQVDQIMANLCVNARDAIADVGKVTVETKNINFDEDYCADHTGFSPGEYVLLAVSDDGIGIAPEILEKIFEPFFTTKGLGQGTGLGLATVYGIVKQNNGFINVYSEQGKGTTIKIYLSRHSGQAVAVNREEIFEIPLSCGETVLLVEDDGSILKLGKRILEELGYTVLAASSPNEAVSLAEEHAGKINLLITDVVMPEMNGRELSEQLQRAYTDLKILFMSGYTADVIAHRGVLEDGVCFIPKPFSKKDMAVKVREVLDGDTDQTQA